MIQTKRIRGLAALGICAVLALSACGSSSSGHAANPTGPAGPAASSSSAVKAKIMIIGDFTSTIPFTVPEIVPTVKGVLRGFPNVQVETCDGKGTAGAYLTCEHKAVSEHVAGVIQGFVTTQDQSYLTKAGIPSIGVTDNTSANSYPVSSSFALYVGLGVGMFKAGCTKLGIVYLEDSDFLVDYIKRGFESQGGKEVARAAVAVNAADLAPAVAKLNGAGAQCVAVSLAPAGAAQALTALKQGGKPLIIGGISAIFSKQLLDSLGKLTNGLIVVDSQLNRDDTGAGIAQVAADEKAESSSAPVTEQSIGSWISARLVAAALPKVQGEVTAPSLTKALDGLRNVDMKGVIPPWSTTTLTSPTFKRVFNHYGINYKIENGKAVREGDFYDIASILQAG